MTKIYHNHHMIPKHMGGSNDPENIIKLTPRQHALAHKKLYEEHGKQEDFIAWKGLSGHIGKEEIIRLKWALGGKNSQSPNGGRACKGVKKNYKVREEELFMIRSRGGKVSTNKDYKHWSNGKDFKFSKEQPEGYSYIKPRFQHLCAISVSKTYWWNDGVSHKRSKTSPGIDFIKGRINKGNLGGIRTRINSMEQRK